MTGVVIILYFVQGAAIFTLMYSGIWVLVFMSAVVVLVISVASNGGI